MLNIPKNDRIGLAEDVCAKKKRTFWDDPALGEKLDGIPQGERGVIIRMALRQYFGIAPGSTPPPDPVRDVEQLRSIFQLFAGAHRAQK